MRTLPLAGTLSAVSPGWSSCQGWGGGSLPASLPCRRAPVNNLFSRPVHVKPHCTEGWIEATKVQDPSALSGCLVLSQEKQLASRPGRAHSTADTAGRHTGLGSQLSGWA